MNLIGITGHGTVMVPPQTFQAEEQRVTGSERPTPTADKDSELTALIDRLVARHGEMVGEGALAALLGYPTLAAFRQSYKRGRVPVPTFKPKHRRGKYALTRDIAAWMHRCSKEAQSLRP